MAVAVVTGGSRGFGLEVASVLATAGWVVVTDGRAVSALRAAAQSPHVRPVPGDITDPAHRRALVDAAVGRGGLDLLVLNAGTLGPSPLPRLADLELDA